MITINNIKVSIDCALGASPVKQKFGFDFPMKKGLNILTGSNTSGKSTVLSVIYYCLGMEQLLGGNKKDILDQSLSKIFSHGKKEYSILYSESFLEITNDENEKAILRRPITSTFSSDNTDNIYVNIDSKEEAFFLHSKGDSDTSAGFYNWLANFSGILLPIYEDENGERTKVLYLQQIFSACFVEQTKGWSDFFAQLPFFKTKNPKTKIIEYLLELKGLINEFTTDTLKEKEKILTTQWRNAISNYNLNIANFKFIVAGLSNHNTSILSKKEINKLQLITIDEGKTRKTYEDIRQEVINQLESLRGAQVNVETGTNNLELLRKQEILMKEIFRINEQLSQLYVRKRSEEDKITSYKEIIKEYNTQIDLLNGEKKTVGLLQIRPDEFDTCPVCDSKLDLSEEVSFSNVERITTDQSIAFYKTEKALYKDYVDKSSTLLNSYNAVESYLKEQLSFNQLHLQQIKEEIVADDRIPSRSDITSEVSYQFELVKLDNLQNTFIKLKENLGELSDSIAVVRSEIKANGTEVEDDDTIVKNFKAQIKVYLKKFEYESHDLIRVDLTDEGVGTRLLPVVKYQGDVQSIRLSSSASDFIRAIWAFYLALLKKSNLHPGFLILDEPGQHAMKFDSLRQLVELATSFKNRQVILAISNDEKISGKNEETKKLSDLLNGINPNKYHLNLIAAGTKCISPL